MTVFTPFVFGANDIGFYRVQWRGILDLDGWLVVGRGWFRLALYKEAGLERYCTCYTKNFKRMSRLHLCASDLEMIINAIV